ncbi:helix-turn-helix domain-containing protein [Kribbella sp. VKM Ac-2568]|uniref:helix-turn-helix domain-containing protein n=1 Tax=Kribbella sp. VKM Ac-2568 TaxID=2512219 RepID=UPI00351AB01F
MVAAADELMSLKGAAATTLDEVTAASGTSKSQIYRHFSDKSALVPGGHRTAGRARART